MALDHFYHEQIKRYLAQFMRVFHGMSVSYIKNGKTVIKQVPVVSGNMSRQVATILKNNSENTLIPAPIIGCFLIGVERDPERRYNAQGTSKVHIKEQRWEPGTGYTGEAGNYVTVERYASVPWNFTFQADVLVSNEEDKHQILEQIMVLFNPAIQIQISRNVADDTSHADLWLDNIQLSNIGQPKGIDEGYYEIASLVFTCKGFISSPAKVIKDAIIQRVNTNLYNVDVNRTLQNVICQAQEGDITPDKTLTITGGCHSIKVEGKNITLLGATQKEYDNDGNIYAWEKIFDPERYMRDGISTIEIYPDDDTVYKGRIFKTAEENVLQWEIDYQSLPVDTLNPVYSVIDPLKSYPGSGSFVIDEGIRYLILDDIPGPSQAWGGLVGASYGDIIQYNNGSWSVVFSAENEADIQYITNIKTDTKLKFSEETGWIVIPDGTWSPDSWRIIY